MPARPEDRLRQAALSPRRTVWTCIASLSHHTTVPEWPFPPLTPAFTRKIWYTGCRMEREKPQPIEIEIPTDVRAQWEEQGTPIVKYPASVLRQAARLLARPTSETRALVERMKAAMFQANGVGLAAPQMGV